jgi:hypothetical protein
MHDFNPSRFRQKWHQAGKAFFLSPMWFLHRPNAYEALKQIVDAGGLKPFYGIQKNQLVEYGADRTLIRYPLDHLQEAVALNPDVILCFDYTISKTDSEQDIVQKLVANESIIAEYDSWLQQHRIRDRHRLLGVAHGVTPEDYADQTRQIVNHANIVGVPAGMYLLKRQYDTLLKILEAVRYEIPEKRPIGHMLEYPTIQLLGYGASNIEELHKIVEFARRTGTQLILEGSTIVRESQVRRVLAVQDGKITYQPLQRVKNLKAREWGPRECWLYNSDVLMRLVQELEEQTKLT